MVSREEKVERAQRRGPVDLAGIGTWINMKIALDSSRTLKEVFDRYSNPDTDDYGFFRAHVPLKLAQYGQDHLMSRFQARRVLGSSGSRKFSSIFPVSNQSARRSPMRFSGCTPRTILR